MRRLPLLIALTWLLAGPGWAQPPVYDPLEDEPSGLKPQDTSVPVPPHADPLEQVPAPETLRLTLDQALQQGLTRNPTLLAADARVRQAYWAYQKTASLPSTQVTLTVAPGTVVEGSNPGGNNPSGVGAGFATIASNGLTDTYVTTTQPFWPLGSYTSGIKMALQDYRVSSYSLETTRLTVRQNVKDAFFGLLAAQEALRVSGENLQLAQLSYDIAQKRFSSGAGPQLDLIDAGVLLSRAQQDQVSAQATLKQAQAALAPLIDVRADTPIQALGQLDVPQLAFEYAQLLELARKNPQIQAALALLEKNRRAVDFSRQQGNLTPMLTFIRDISTHTDQTQAGFQFPIDWGQIRNDVRSKEESVLEQQYNLLAAQLQISSNLKAAFESYLGSYRNASDFRERVLLPSEESTRITQYGYKRGALPYLRLLTSQQNLAAVRREYIGLLQSVFVSLDAVEAATGQPLPGPAPKE
jgi:cobalt-zinc-cadmium efflux system outer membrane protein